MDDEKPDWIKKLEAEVCECVRCELCEGTGTVYYSFDGKYQGRQHWDDMDDPEPCEECSNGVTDECDRCMTLNNYDRGID